LLDRCTESWSSSKPCPSYWMRVPLMVEKNTRSTAVLATKAVCAYQNLSFFLIHYTIIGTPYDLHTFEDNYRQRVKWIASVDNNSLTPSQQDAWPI